MHSIDFLTDDSRVATTLGKAMHRRAIMKGLAGAGAAALAVATIGPALANHTSQLYTVSANANFRAAPDVTASLLGVVYKGATFQINGQVQNGYAGIIYNGKTGWVVASLVVAAGGGGTPTTPTITGQAWTTSAVNLRTGPGTSYAVLKVVPSGSVIGTSTTVQNGFRFVKAGTASGWVSDAYLAPYSPGPSAGNPPAITGVGVTLSSVNLRSGPGTSYGVLKVVPAGAKIGTSTTVQNGFRYVSHNGLGGWMAEAYIGFGDGGGGPVPSYQTTTANLNLRAEPSGSAPILLVVPSGSKVVPNGSMAYGYAQVTYNGVKGWVLAAYLQ
jgi:uncharacterized protein YraI